MGGKCLARALSGFAALSLLLAASAGLAAPATRDTSSAGDVKFNLGGEIETSADFLYRTSDYNYLFEFPLSALLWMGFSSENYRAMISVDYYGENGLGELALGETYILGGTEFSNMKIGNFVEDWSTAYSASFPSVLNVRDDRYPDNVFYAQVYRPNPLATLTFGNEKFYVQTALSNREEDVSSIEDTDIGVRGVMPGEAVRLSFGFARKLGSPPPLFFAGVEQFNDAGRYWTEIDWEYHESGADVWNFAVGTEREISIAKVYVEYLLLDGEDVVFLQENIKVREVGRFDLKAYIHLPDFSTALSGFFVLDLGPGCTFEPGFYGFIGEKGMYFSPLEAENDNRVVLRLRLVF